MSIPPGRSSRTYRAISSSSDSSGEGLTGPGVVFGRVVGLSVISGSGVTTTSGCRISLGEGTGLGFVVGLASGAGAGSGCGLSPSPWLS